MWGWLIFFIVLVYIKVKYRPELEVVEDDYSISFIVFYSVRTKEGAIRREFFELFNLKNNDW